MLFDSEIKTGAGIIKELSSGTKVVLIGPVIYRFALLLK